MPEPLTLESLAARVEALEATRRPSRSVFIPTPTAEECATRLEALEELTNLEDYDFEAYRQFDAPMSPADVEGGRDPR